MHSFRRSLSTRMRRVRKNRRVVIQDAFNNRAYREANSPTLEEDRIVPALNSRVERAVRQHFYVSPLRMMMTWLG